MRSLVQYDFDESTAPPSDTRQLPTKKRKRNHRNPQRSQAAQAQKMPIQHWDDPGSAAVGMIYDEQEASTVPSVPVHPSVESVKVTAGADDLEEEEEEYGEVIEGDYAGGEEEESRELAHDEIWDDSALIDAWNSAEAEYEVSSFFPSSSCARSRVPKRPITALQKHGKRNLSRGPHCASRASCFVLPLIQREHCQMVQQAFHSARQIQRRPAPRARGWRTRTRHCPA